VGIVISDRQAAAARVNAILGEHAGLIAGRMGMPSSDRRQGLIALMIQGTSDEISALTGKLGNIPGVRVRSAVII